MILTADKIKQEIAANHISIEPFDEKYLNPHSYNLHLGKKLLVYKDDVLDVKKNNPVDEIIISDDGFTLEKGKLYLGSTLESVWSDKYAPMLCGRSSLARLGLPVHLAAGFGDVGWRVVWTLELAPTMYVTVYEGVPVAQVYFESLKGKITSYDDQASAKYQNATEVQASRLYLDYGVRNDFEPADGRQMNEARKEIERLKTHGKYDRKY